MIAKETIDAVFDTVRVEEVIGDFVQLKRAGSNFKGLSPFVNEKTPSFMVSPAKQIWKDFSSGKGGNAITFIMEHEHFSFPEAIRYLAKKYNIEIIETVETSEDQQLQNEKESMFVVSEFAAEFFSKQLWETDEGKSVGLSYFKQRGFTEETIKKFKLGYSPNAWTAFSDEALKNGYNIQYLEKTGLTIVKEEKHFDRFRSRVIFPIQSLAGRVLGFGGRILINDKKAAKYLNSPESEIYHKSKVLYGLYQAKQSIVKNDNCYLVEGYTDVIQFSQAGIENVVASSGTALTTDQIRLIQRLTQNVTVLFDGDAAGLRASLRGIDMILEAGMNVRVCAFPEGEDPDSMARNLSYDDLRAYLESNQTDFIRFKVNVLLKDAANDPLKKAEVIKEIVTSISKIPDPIKRELYVKECASILDISEAVLFSSLEQLNKKEVYEANKKFVQEKKLEAVKTKEIHESEKVDIQSNLERKIIEILLLYGDVEEQFEEYIFVTEDEAVKTKKIHVTRKVIDQVYMSLQDDETEFINPKYKKIFDEIIAYYQTNGKWHFEEFMTNVSPEFIPEITSIIMNEEKETLHNWESQNIFVKEKQMVISQLTTETLMTLRWYLLNQIINQLKQETLKPDVDHYEILVSLKEYLGLSNQFSSKLGRLISRF